MTRASTCMLARGGLLLYLAALCTGALVGAQPYPTSTVVCTPQPATFSGATLPTPDPTAAPGSPSTTHVCGTTSWSSQCVSESEPGPQYIGPKTATAVYHAARTAAVFSFHGPVGTAGSVSLLPVGTTEDPTLLVVNAGSHVGSLPTEVTVRAQTGTSNLLTFAHDSPIVKSSARASSCAAAATSQTVLGTNFAPTDLTAPMTIGGGQCGTAGCNAQGAAVSALAQSDSSARFAAPAVDVARSSVLLIPTAKPSPIDVMCNAPSTTGFAGM